MLLVIFMFLSLFEIIMTFCFFHMSATLIFNVKKEKYTSLSFCLAMKCNNWCMMCYECN